MRSQLATVFTVSGLALAGLAIFLGAGGRALPAILAGAAAMVLLVAAATASHPLAGAAASGLFGTGISTWLLFQHRAALAGAHSFCSVSALFDCDAVNSSRFSEFHGVPVALLGAAFYAAITLVAWNGWRERPGYGRSPVLVLAGAIAACAVSAGMAWASAQLGAWCLFCMALYGVAVLLLVAGILASSDTGFSAGQVLGTLTGRGDRSAGTALSVAAVVLVGGMVLGGRNSAATGGSGDDRASLASLYVASPGPVPLRGDEPSWGSPDARRTVVVFADFQCPYCAAEEPRLREVVDRHPDFHLVFKNYPLSDECNPHVPGARHADSCRAASAALCGQAQGRFWELADLLFKNQHNLSQDDIMFMAGDQVGLDTEALAACMADPATAGRIGRDADDGAALHIDSTPSIFVSGLLDEGWVKLTEGHEALERLIEAVDSGQHLPPPAG